MQLIDSLVDWYKGSFVNGKREGHGRFVSALGETYEGEWEDDIFVCGPVVCFPHQRTFSSVEGGKGERCGMRIET